MVLLVLQHREHREQCNRILGSTLLNFVRRHPLLRLLGVHDDAAPCFPKSPMLGQTSFGNARNLLRIGLCPPKNSTHSSNVFNLCKYPASTYHMMVLTALSSSSRLPWFENVRSQLPSHHNVSWHGPNQPWASQPAVP